MPTVFTESLINMPDW